MMGLCDLMRGMDQGCLPLADNTDQQLGSAEQDVPSAAVPLREAG
jgi:hypothetical protein